MASARRRLGPRTLLVIQRTETCEPRRVLADEERPLGPRTLLVIQRTETDGLLVGFDLFDHRGPRTLLVIQRTETIAFSSCRSPWLCASVRGPSSLFRGLKLGPFHVFLLYLSRVRGPSSLFRGLKRCCCYERVQHGFLLSGPRTLLVIQRTETPLLALFSLHSKP